MRITKQRLKSIITEEVSKILMEEESIVPDWSNPEEAERAAVAMASGADIDVETPERIVAGDYVSQIFDLEIAISQNSKEARKRRREGSQLFLQALNSGDKGSILGLYDLARKFHDLGATLQFPKHLGVKEKLKNDEKINKILLPDGGGGYLGDVGLHVGEGAGMGWDTVIREFERYAKPRPQS